MRLPQFQTCLEKIIHPEIIKYSDESKVHFLSEEGRSDCLLKTISFLFLTIIGPFMGLVGAYKASNTSHTWKALDMALSFVAMPVSALSCAIRALAGAIIHPTLFYTLEKPTEAEAV